MLIPFVNNSRDIRTIRKIIREVQKEVRANTHDSSNPVSVGAMIETPAAAMRAGEILAESDFVSIGTNDLIQYITAADRESISVSHYYEDGIGLALNMITPVISESENLGKECILCGELAGNTGLTEQFITSGLRHFSVMPPLVPSIKEIVFNFKEKERISAPDNSLQTTRKGGNHESLRA
jgi:phosphotransferase system enzyme I (PtsI)